VTREFVVLPDANAVAAATADRLLAAGQAAIDDHGTFYLVLTGGSTPQLVCPLLVVPPRVLQLDWTKVEFFFGDARAVPARHPDSNYNTARQTLLDYLPRVGPGQVHRMIGEAADLDAAARAYQALINRIVPKEQVMQASLALAEELAGKPPVAMRLNKARFREVTEESFRECLAAGIRNQRAAYATGEPARMMEAFLAKRAARKTA